MLAVIGIVEYPTHLVIVNRAGVDHARAPGTPFRANSLFYDPNIFGRFLALVVLVGAGSILAARLREPAEGRRRALRLTGRRRRRSPPSPSWRPSHARA